MTATATSILRATRSVLIVGAIAFATTAVVSKVTAASPGQVGNAPRCTATAIGPSRGQAFHTSGANTTVRFKVTGSNNCKVQLSVNSFYAPSANGRPYDKQTLYHRVTKVFSRGTYSMTSKLPTSSTPAKGCYYQVDLTYGVHNHTPVLAWQLGKIQNCGKKPPQPQLTCQGLTFAVLPQQNNTYRFTATASAKHTKITKYVFRFGDGSSRTVSTSKSSTSVTHTYGQADHEFMATVTVSSAAVKDITNARCQVTVKTPPTPKTPQLICESLEANRVGTSSTGYDFTAHASAKDTAITTYHFAFGDGKTDTVTTSDTSATIRHNYASARKDYTATVTVDSEDQKGVTSAACTVAITGKKPPEVLGTTTTPPTTTELPDTGPGDVMGFFAATATAGAVIHRFVLRRKIA